jgi:hypothetical protein
MVKYCKCGCGEVIPDNRTWKHGHNAHVLHKNINEDYLRYLYEEKEFSMQDIAHLLSCDRGAIRRRLVYMGIPIKSRGGHHTIWSDEERLKMSESCKRAYANGKIRLKGSLNPNWRGGYKGRYNLTHDEWYNLREDILKRDNYSCQSCGSIENLHIHHIIPFRISKDNSMTNLITLCSKCHKRIDWEYRKNEECNT